MKIDDPETGAELETTFGVRVGETKEVYIDSPMSALELNVACFELCGATAFSIGRHGQSVVACVEPNPGFRVHNTHLLTDAYTTDEAAFYFAPKLPPDARLYINGWYIQQVPNARWLRGGVLAVTNPATVRTFMGFTLNKSHFFTVDYLVGTGSLTPGTIYTIPMPL